MSFKDKLKDSKKLRELFLYLLFGVLTTLLNLVIFTLLNHLFGLDSLDSSTVAHKVLLNLSTVTAWVISVAFAFFTNRKFVFEGNRKLVLELRDFYLARLLSYLIFDFVFLNVIVYALGLDELISKLAANLLVIIFNYVASKFFVFRHKTK